MNREVRFTAAEVRKNAIEAMETCMADITVGRNTINVIRDRGQATVWEGILNDVFGEDFWDDDHYQSMHDTYRLWLYEKNPELNGKITNDGSKHIGDAEREKIIAAINNYATYKLTTASEIGAKLEAYGFLKGLLSAYDMELSVDEPNEKVIKYINNGNVFFHWKN